MSGPRGFLRPLRALLRRLLPSELAADLDEGYARRLRTGSRGAARRWYLRQALSALLQAPGLVRLSSPSLPRPAMLFQDLRLALRGFLRRPGFSAVIVLTLAVALGANTTVYSLVDALFLRSVPVHEPERVVEVYGSSEQDGNLGAFSAGFLPVSWPNLETTFEEAATLDGGYAYFYGEVSLRVGDRPERGFVQYVSASYFDVLGVRPALGRAFQPEEDEDLHAVAVLAHGFWQSRFGGDPGVVGRTVWVNTRPYTVVGVAPEDFQGTAVSNRPVLWAPLPMVVDIPVWGAFKDNRSARIFFGGARLAPGRTVDDARAELARIAGELEATYPDINEGMGFRLVPLPEATLNPNMKSAAMGASTVLAVMVLVVLLIACMNVANLLLARAMGRRREMAIRSSLGAGRARMAGQLLTETVLLFGAGAVGGLGLTLLAQDALGRIQPPFLLGSGLELRMDPRLFLVTAGVTLAAALVFGLLPALRGARTDVATDLRSDDRSGTRRGGKARQALVAGQMALSVVALVGAGLFVRGLGEAREIELGFEPAGLGLLSVDLGAQGYGPEEGLAWQGEVVRAVEALPEVSAAALAEHGPLEASGLLPLAPDSAAFLDPHGRRYARVTPASPGYADVAGLTLLRGRWLEAADRADAPGVIVLNRAAADLFWPDDDPLGREVVIGPEGRVATVVGLVPTGRYVTLNEDPQPVAYVPLEQSYAPSVTVFLRGTAGGPPPLESARAAVSALDPELPVFDVEAAPAAVDRALWTTRAVATVLAAFGLIGLLLAAVGVYGVITQWVRERRRETGLRMALGAEAGRVLRGIMLRALAMVGAGLAVGLALALAGSRALATQLHGVSATDPLTYGSVLLVLSCVAVLAAFLPARRATRVDPAITLKGE